jgi:hypothetical protein
MYRCQVCRRRTEDIDSPPCISNDHVFTPQKIDTIHKYDYKNGYVTVRCTGAAPTPNMIGLGSDLGINCIRCRTIMQQEAAASRIPKPAPSFSRDNGAVGVNSTTSKNTDKLPPEDNTSLQ